VSSRHGGFARRAEEVATSRPPRRPCTPC
jgi:hypothetical protein